MRYGYWMPVFGGWLRNVPDEGMEASWDYARRLTQDAERWGYDLTLIAELNLNDIKGIEQPALDAGRRRARGPSMPGHRPTGLSSTEGCGFASAENRPAPQFTARLVDDLPSAGQRERGHDCCDSDVRPARAGADRHRTHLHAALKSACACKKKTAREVTPTRRSCLSRTLKSEL